MNSDVKNKDLQRLFDVADISLLSGTHLTQLFGVEVPFW
jgi:hypothetical protein